MTRPVDQQEVDGPEPDGLQAALDAVHELRPVELRVRDLGRDEHLRARNAAAAHGLADAGLGAIALRRVDMAVADLQRLQDGGHARLAGSAGCAQAEFRNLRHDMCHPLWLRR